MKDIFLKDKTPTLKVRIITMLWQVVRFPIPKGDNIAGNEKGSKPVANILVNLTEYPMPIEARKRSVDMFPVPD